MTWLDLLNALLITLLSFWFLGGPSLLQAQLPTLRQKRICLLIAHPDDEAMFFAPTLLALTKAELGNHVKILCLSSGNSEGLGEIRKRELVKSAFNLGLSIEKDVLVVDREEFPDSMTTTWDTLRVADLLFTSFAPDSEIPPQKTADNPHRPTVDVIITFDSKGISGHLNHISLYHGARHFVTHLSEHQIHGSSPVDLYTLTSISTFRKYTFIFDILTSTVDMALNKNSNGPKSQPTSLLFINSPAQFRCAQHSMTKCHESQMKWFRWGWIFLSRYMTINKLRLEHFVREDQNGKTA